MAQEKKLNASFKSKEMAAVFGLTVESIGTVTYSVNGHMTVDFGSVIAERVSASLFNIVKAAKPAKTPELTEVRDEGNE